jgi:Rieske Fe-S protein
LKQSLALLVTAVTGLVPLAAGFAVLLDPLRRKSAAGQAIRVTTIEVLPADGVPRKFPVIASRTDAWSKYPNAPIGAVYLRRTQDDKVEALNAVCPHAGCFVDFSEERSEFLCPCHASSFAVDGKIARPGSPSPRALDSLEVKVDDDGVVWVTFQNFLAGRSDKVPVA